MNMGVRVREERRRSVELGREGRGREGRGREGIRREGRGRE